MGLFKKKSFDELEGHNYNLFTDDDDDGLIDASPFSQGVKNRAAAPHAMTVDEIVGTETEEIPMSSARPTPDSVYEQLKEKKSLQQPIEDDYVPSWATSKMEEPKNNTYSEPYVNVTVQPETEEEHDDFLAKCKMAVDIATSGVHYDEKDFENFAKEDYYKTLETEKAVESVDVDDIIRRLKSENNIPEVVEPEITAVEEEIKAEGKSELGTEAILGDFSREVVEDTAKEIPTETELSEAAEDVIALAADVLKEEPEISVDEIKMESETPINITEREESDESSEEDVKVFVVQPEVSDETDPNAVKVEVEVIPMDSESDIMHTEVASDSMRTYGKIYQGVVMGHTEKGDVQLDKVIDAAKSAVVAEEMASTVVFDATNGLENLGSVIAQKADESFYEENDYDDIDEDSFEELPYYETEDRDLVGIDDYQDLNDAARLRTKFMEKCAAGTLFTVMSFGVTALMVLISCLSGVALAASFAGYVNLLLLVAVISFNLGIFADLKGLFEGNVGFDTCVATASVAMLMQNVVSCVCFDGAYSTVTGAAAFLLSINSLFKLLRNKRILKGLVIIANSETKMAVTAAGGAPAATIASGTVDGDAIVLSGRKVTNVKGYLKNCGYKSPFDLKAKTLFVLGALTAFVAGVVTGILLGLGTGVTVAALTLCACYPACAIMTAEGPMQIITKKLNDYGAMLAGYKGIYNLNKANVIGVKTSDLFPEGSLTLYDMKPLSQNEVAHSLLRAAAVAIAAESPLTPIFKGIIGDISEDELPKVSGVQYEDKMGLAGWIGDLTILIGNRNLMQGHNVPVPPASVDQKILKNGYFPVYIACDGVPCLLFIVKYEADEMVGEELQKVTEAGVSVVVYPEDPNASDVMICDYFGLNDGAVKLMRHNGRVAFEKATVPAESTGAPASYGKSICGLFAAVSAAKRIKSVMAVLTAVYVIAAVLGTVLVSYLAVVGRLSLVTSLAFIAVQAAFMLISFLFARMVRR